MTGTFSQTRRIFSCPSCGHQETERFPRCPACERWLEDGELVVENAEQADTYGTAPVHPACSASGDDVEEAPRIATGVAEFDRVLGGGIPRSSVLLFTGPPGVGKSTLLMMVAARVAETKGPVLLVSAEESERQARARARRIGAAQADLFILADNGLEEAVSEMKRLEAAIVVIDSLQLMKTQYSENAPGSAVQVKEVSAKLTEIAKKRGVPILVSGQIVKSGKFAGPMSVPHMYDGVFRLDEVTLPGFVLLRVEKYRFGSKTEVGSFKMTALGLEGVASPSSEILKGGGKGIITVAMEGTKPIATELQIGFINRGDLSAAILGYPKERLRLIQTILDRCGIQVPSTLALDVLGGYRISDSAADLAVAVAAAYAVKTALIPKGWAAIGEVALDGRLLPPHDFAERVRELQILGVENVILPFIGSESLSEAKAMKIHPTRTLFDALRVIGFLDEFKSEKPAVQDSPKDAAPADRDFPQGRPKEVRETRASSVASAIKRGEKDARRQRKKRKRKSAAKKAALPKAPASPETRRDKSPRNKSRDPRLERISELAKKHGGISNDIIRRELRVSIHHARELFERYRAYRKGGTVSSSDAASPPPIADR